jgi:hypothetical protein
MSYRTDNGLMFDRRSLDDVLMNELPAHGVQKPPTDGPVASSTRPAHEPEPHHQNFGDIH